MYAHTYSIVRISEVQRAMYIRGNLLSTDICILYGPGKLKGTKNPKVFAISTCQYRMVHLLGN